MKAIQLIALVVAGTCISCQSKEQNTTTTPTENIKSFAKLYGYVRYFHPSDEASKIDWNKFALYGVKEVEKASDKKELLAVLNKLFKPVAPSVLIYSVNDSIQFDVKSVTPPNVKDYKEIYWQHLGLGNGKKRLNDVYQSERINRLIAISDESGGGGYSFCTITKRMDAKPYIGKEFEYTAYVKMGKNNASKGYLWARVDKDTTSRDKTLFFDNMSDRPIVSGDWSQYKVKGKIDSLARYIYFGAFTADTLPMFVDNMQFSIKDSKGESTVIFSDGFENDSLNITPIGFSKGPGNRNNSKTGTVMVVTNEHYEGKNCVKVANTTDNSKMIMAEPLFTFKPSIDKPFYADLGNEIHCTVPLMLYGTTEQTYPAADTASFNSLLKKLNEQSMDKDGKDLHYADLVIYYNKMQHFFPYFDVIKTNWEEAFTQALKENASCENNECFLPILKRFASKLHDGHGHVYSYSGNQNFSFLPPIEIAWIENKLIITKILDKSSTLTIGTEIKKIENINSRKYYDSVAQYISAGTKGWLEERENMEILYGPDSSKLNLEVIPPGGTPKSASLSRLLNANAYYGLTENTTKYKEIDASTYYLNIDQISEPEIDSLMPELEKAKCIICDLRGYPNSNHEFISHLLTMNDTCKTWMRVPEIIYPNYTVSGFQPFGWEMTPEKPHLTAKIIFITGGGAISYAESYMGFIQGYRLATIVGQPTAGTNGNINQIYLPGGYGIVFTGMKVLKQDGSQLYGIGFIPDVIVNETIKGVMEGRDEFLEKAVEISNQY